MGKSFVIPNECVVPGIAKRHIPDAMTHLGAVITKASETGTLFLLIVPLH